MSAKKSVGAVSAAIIVAAIPATTATAHGPASPRSTKLPTGTPQQAGSAAVPTLAQVTKRQAVMLAPVTISGRTVLMTVDTGAETTQIYRSAAGVLKLPKVGKPTSVTSIGCTSTAQPVALKSWKIGQVAAPNLVASSTKGAGKLKRIKKIPIVGLLGADALSSYGTVGVDFTHTKLLLGGTFTPSATTFAAKTKVSKATKRPGLLAAAIAIRGVKRTFAVDTGASQTTLDPKIAKKARLRSAGKTKSVSAVSCKTKVNPVRVPKWNVGGVDVPGTIALSKRSDLSKIGLDGLVGAEILSKFGLVTFDYKGLRIALGYPAAPAPTPAPTPAAPTPTTPTPPGGNGGGAPEPMAGPGKT